MSHFRQQPPLPLRPFLIEGLFYYFQLYVCVWSVYGYVHMKARGLGFGQSGCWGLNLGLLQERYLLFTAEPPLQLCFFFVTSLCPSTCFKSTWGVCVVVDLLFLFFFFFHVMYDPFQSNQRTYLPQTLCSQIQNLCAVMKLLWCPRKSFSWKFTSRLHTFFNLGNPGCLCSLSELPPQVFQSYCPRP